MVKVTRDRNGHLHVFLDSAESKHDPKNGQFAKGGGSGGGSEEQHPHSHMNALQDRLYRETQRLKNAPNERERKFRETQVTQAKKEIAQEKVFLEKKGTPYKEDEGPDLSEEELLKELLK
jgi:hypothetical protein